MPHTEVRVRDVILEVTVLAPQRRGALYVVRDIDRAFSEAQEFHVGRRTDKTRNQRIHHHHHHHGSPPSSVATLRSSRSSAGALTLKSTFVQARVCSVRDTATRLHPGVVVLLVCGSAHTPYAARRSSWRACVEEAFSDDWWGGMLMWWFVGCNGHRYQVRPAARTSVGS